MDLHVPLVCPDRRIDLATGKHCTAAGVDVNIYILSIGFCQLTGHILRASGIHIEHVIDPFVIVSDDRALYVNFHTLTSSQLLSPGFCQNRSSSPPSIGAMWNFSLHSLGVMAFRSTIAT